MTIPAITVSIGQRCHGHDGPSRAQFNLVLDGDERRFGDTSNCRTAGLKRLPCPLPGPGVWIKVRSLLKVSPEPDGWLEFRLVANACSYLFKRLLSSSNSLTVKVVY